MISPKPFIHLFKTYGGKYLYDVNRNEILPLTDEEYNIMEFEMEHWNAGDSVKRICHNKKLKRMLDEGYLSPSTISEIIHPEDKLLEDHLDNRVRMLTLQVTQQCNLRCEYCVYSGIYENNRVHTGKRMTFDTAKKGIDFLYEHSRDINTVSIGFYGGEPLLEFELMKKCVEYVKKKFEGKEYQVNFTTNGTLINKDIADFLSENKIKMLISLDGPKNVHDKNRKFAFDSCGTFDKVIENVEFLLNNYPEYKECIMFNTVIDPTMDISCSNEFFTGFDAIKEFKTSHNAQFISDMDIKHTEKIRNSIEFEKEWNYELFKMYLHKLGRIGGNHVSNLVSGQYNLLNRTNSIFGYKIHKIGKCHHGGPCIPGARRLFVDVDGNILPCERVNETSEVMRIGHVDCGFDIEKIRNLLNVGKLTEEKCKNCWAIFLCGQCAKSADAGNALSADIKEAGCERDKKSAEATLRDICSMKEMGHLFDEEEGMSVMSV